MADDEGRSSMQLDEELLRRCARGEAAAYRELVGRVEKPLISFLLRFVGQAHVAEDLFQETFVRVVRSLGDFQPKASLTTWIYTIARNLALDWLKSKRRHREQPLDAATPGEGGRLIYFKDLLHAASPGPGARAEASEEERRLTEALGRLSPAKREAVTLRVFAGLPYAEVARIVGAPVGTVKFRIHEAVRELGKMLGADEDRSSTAQGGTA